MTGAIGSPRIGGSDNHDAAWKPSLPIGQLFGDIHSKVELPNSSLVGMPTTVVHARELSMPAILAAIRAGHVFIDVQGSRDRMLDLTAHAGRQQVEMGDALVAPAGSTVHFTVRVTALSGDRIEIIEDGKPIRPDLDLAIHSAKQSVSFDWRSDGKRHWLRANVRGAGRQLLLVGNPIYVNTE